MKSTGRWGGCSKWPGQPRQSPSDRSWSLCTARRIKIPFSRWNLNLCNVAMEWIKCMLNCCVQVRWLLTSYTWSVTLIVVTCLSCSWQSYVTSSSELRPLIGISVFFAIIIYYCYLSSTSHRLMRASPAWWKPFSRIWNPATSIWTTQLTWLRTVHSGDRCLHRLSLAIPACVLVIAGS